MKMPLKYKILIIVTILGCLLVGFTVFMAVHTLFTAPSVAPKQGNPTPMPTFAEIQEMLVDRGYDIGTHGIDGNLGCPDSNSQKAWNRAICDQYNREICSRMSGESK